MREAAGWLKKECQACFALLKVGGKRRFHVHHVFGHPDHSRLVVLCAGCHQIVSKLAWRKPNLATLRRLMEFVQMQASKHPVSLELTERIVVLTEALQQEAPALEVVRPDFSMCKSRKTRFAQCAKRAA